eukprot:m.33826 g.33826  ORF g.33826 m.33826 type:complete len:193 (-) comp9883_c0_seq1:138-716(-)
MATTGMRPNKSGKELGLHVFYSLMLFVVVIIGTYAIASPYWLNVGYGSKGLLSSCSNRSDINTCERYTVDQLKNEIPTEWRGAAGTFAFGLFIIWLSFFVSLVTCCCLQAATKPQRFLIPVACLFIGVGVVLFAAGFGDDFVTSICPGAKNFDKGGSCSFGDAGAAAIVSVVLGFIASFISCCVKPAEESFA